MSTAITKRMTTIFVELYDDDDDDDVDVLCKYRREEKKIFSLEWYIKNEWIISNIVNIIS